MMTKDYRNALNDARQSTHYNAKFVKGFMREAKCHMILGSLSLGKKCLEKALEIEPNNKQAQQEVSNLIQDREKDRKHSKTWFYWDRSEVAY